jgi:hypothetical protein
MERTLEVSLSQSGHTDGEKILYHLRKLNVESPVVYIIAQLLYWLSYPGKK